MNPQIYPGEKWKERDKRMPIPATVISVDEDFVYLQRDRRTRVRISNFLKRFDKVEHAPRTTELL